MEIKMIREYSLKNGVLNCVSTPLFPDDMSDGFPIYLAARVAPKDPSSLDCMRFRIQSHSETSPSLILDEAEYFIQTIRKMYEL